MWSSLDSLKLIFYNDPILQFLTSDEINTISHQRYHSAVCVKLTKNVVSL